MMRCAVPAVIAFWVVTGLAQPGNTLVVPNALATVEGNSGNSYPFNIGANTMRYQQVYAASQFGDMPAGGALINGIGFRRDAGWGTFSATLPAIQINLSTTAKAPDALSPTFAGNVGPDDTVVFNGPLALSSTATGSPAPFDIIIPLTNSFFYDPAAGNLLLEVRNSGGGNSSQFDSVLAPGDPVSRAYNPVNFTTGSTDTVGLVTMFIFGGPVVTRQPQSQTVACGSRVIFKAEAVGRPPLFYQWRRNESIVPGYSVPIEGAATLTLTDVDPTAAGVYRVVVSNSDGSVTSAPAALMVVDPTPYALTATRQGSNAVFRWPVTCASYVLQEAPSLEVETTWTAVPMSPVMAGGSNEVTLPMETGSRFYRLVSGDALADSSSDGFWTDNGPGLAGRLSAIVAGPNDPGTLLVSSPGGGVWRTMDGGLNWAQPGNYALADYSVVHLEWDRIRSGRLYASTYSDLYASTDLGDHWSNLTHFGGYPAPLMPLDHTSDPRPFAQLRYSESQSTVFWSKPCLGLYYSYDGSTFTHHWPFPGGATNLDNCILAIAADDATGYVYFSTMARNPFLPAHLFRSACPWTPTTPCLSWVSVNSGLPNYSQVASIAYGGSANVLAVALTTGGATVVYTTTTGTAWSAASMQPPSPAWDPRILVSPAPNQLLLATVLGYQTTDWGDHWSQVWYSGMHPDVRSFYWGSFPFGNFLWMTTDGSASSGSYAAIARWNFLPGSAPTGGVTIGVNGLNTWQCFFMEATGISGGARRRIFLGSLDNGCLCSDDGTTWTDAGTPPSGCGDYASMVFAPNNPDRAYARTCDGLSFVRSDNAFSAPTCAAVTWTTYSPSDGNYLPDIWSEAMTAVDPNNADRVCFARSSNIGVSTDGGSIWTTHSLPGNAHPICVFYNDNGDLYAGTLDAGAYKSIDNGATWAAFGLNSPAPKAVLKVAHSPAGGGEGTFFLATTRGLYRKLPGGTFTLRTTDPSYTVSDVEVDPNNPNRICAARGYAGTAAQHRGGVLLSLDNGTTFTSLTAGLDIHQAPISDIQIDPVDSRVIHAAVFGLGGWTYFAP